MTNNSWPVADLESVQCCPICASAQRGLLYAGLTDRVFRVAPGEWSLYGCKDCGSAYLDPRPTVTSVGRAYSSYYTHDAVDNPIVRRIGRFRTLLHDMINGYLNHKYGLQRKPASTIGRLVIPLLPSLKTAADSEIRRLPRLPYGAGRLLDVGCGNGGFLMLAQEAGWSADGIDVDAAAVNTARARGLTVIQGGIEVLDGQRNLYDVITISHVVEHVHDPASLLRSLYRLLKPGGLLSLETPNIESLGARRYRRNWLALDPPRHLMIFSEKALRKVLSEAGFKQLKRHWRGLVVFGVFAESDAMEAGTDVLKASRDGRPPTADLFFELIEMISPKQREFLTYTAQK